MLSPTEFKKNASQAVGVAGFIAGLIKSALFFIATSVIVDPVRFTRRLPMFVIKRHEARAGGRKIPAPIRSPRWSPSVPSWDELEIFAPVKVPVGLMPTRSLLWFVSPALLVAIIWNVPQFGWIGVATFLTVTALILVARYQLQRVTPKRRKWLTPIPRWLLAIDVLAAFGWILRFGAGTPASKEYLVDLAMAYAALFVALALFRLFHWWLMKVATGLGVLAALGWILSLTFSDLPGRSNLVWLAVTYIVTITIDWFDYLNWWCDPPYLIRVARSNIGARIKGTVGIYWLHGNWAPEPKWIEASDISKPGVTWPPFSMFWIWLQIGHVDFIEKNLKKGPSVRTLKWRRFPLDIKDLLVSMSTENEDATRYGTELLAIQNRTNAGQLYLKVRRENGYTHDEAVAFLAQHGYDVDGEEDIAKAVEANRELVERAGNSPAPLTP